MSSWTRINALPTIALATQRSPRAALVSAAACSTIRSKFSVKCSAEAALPAEFSTRSSAAVGHAQKIAGAVRICATTWKSNWKRQLLVRTNRLKSRNWILAINARAAALKRVRARPPVQPAAVVGRLSVHVDFFTFRRRVLAVTVWERSLRNRARNAVARGAWKD